MDKSKVPRFLWPTLKSPPQPMGTKAKAAVYSHS